MVPCLLNVGVGFQPLLEFQKRFGPDVGVENEIHQLKHGVFFLEQNFETLLSVLWVLVNSFVIEVLQERQNQTPELNDVLKDLLKAELFFGRRSLHRVHVNVQHLFEILFEAIRIQELEILLVYLNKVLLVQERVVHAQRLDKSHGVYRLVDENPKSLEIFLFGHRFFAVLENKVEVFRGRRVLLHEVKLANVLVRLLKVLNEIVHTRILVVLVRIYDFSNKNLVWKAVDAQQRINSQQRVLFLGQNLAVFFSIFFFELHT